MLWLLVIGLLAWVSFLTLRVSDLRERTRWLERRVVDLRERVEGGAEAVGPTAAAAPAPAVSATPQGQEGPGVLPPTASRRPERPAPAAAESVPSVQSERTAADPPKPSGPPPREVIRIWLEENGLAWAGGAALALGGLFLVTYAAQRGVFTPPFRIAAAVITGVVLLGASEWLKRRSGHPLAAALAAGAGAATLYGGAWASYWLYDFIDVSAAGGLLGLISVGLLALSFRHGEPLAILAILGGFLAPAVTGPEQWSAPALTAYLGLITLTGYIVAAARRWGQAGMATMVGALGWAFAGFAAEGYARVAALALGPLVLASAAVEWRRRKGEAVLADGQPSAFTLMPTAALVAAVFPLAGLWLASGEAGGLSAAGAASAAIALLGASAARRGLIPPTLLVPGLLPALGALAASSFPGVAAGPREAWGAVLVLALVGAGLVGGARGGELTGRLAAAVAPVAALLVALTLGGPRIVVADWTAMAALGSIVLLAAALIARRSEAPQTDLPLAIWIWTAGAAALHALVLGLDPRALPAAAAGLSLIAAALHARLGWRGFAAVMLAGALCSLSALMSPALFDALANRRLTWWGLALVAAASVALVAAGARIAAAPGRSRTSAEALGTGALLIGLAGAGVLLRLAASPAVAGGGTLDLFLEASLRTVLILAAGLTSAMAVREDSSLIGRWRGQVLLALGVVHGFVMQAAAFNPLWAWWKPAVAGPPLLDSLAIGFLAPGVLLAAATWRRVSVSRTLLAAYGLGAAAFICLWALMETRRLFQGASLHAGIDAVGRAEVAAYAVLLLAGARAAVWLGERAAERPWTVSPWASEIVRLGRLAGWVALAYAAFTFAYAASPWWGPIDRPLAGVRATSLLFGLYVVGAAAAFLVGESAARGGLSALARAARLTVVATAFAFLSLVVRLSFRGYDMRPDLREASLETWTFSAAWGLFGFGLLIYGAARRSNDLRGAGLAVLAITLAKIFLFDMSRLDGVVRAGSFLAVGALLLMAAVLVRRLSGTDGLPFGLGRRPAGPEAER